jgi:hypothetical protein
MAKLRGLMTGGYQIVNNAAHWVSSGPAIGLIQSQYSGSNSGHATAGHAYPVQ